MTTDANGNATFTVTICRDGPARPDRHRDGLAQRLVHLAIQQRGTVPSGPPPPRSSPRTRRREGSWRNAYGADGYDIAADTSANNPKLPSYATLGITGASTYTWATSTTDVRALQNAANTGRIAAAWYSTTSMSFNLNLNDGQSHEVSLYAVDWDNRGRSEEVQVIDATTGTVLDTETISRSRTARTCHGTSRETS